jgi:hypothetical protein
VTRHEGRELGLGARLRARREVVEQPEEVRLRHALHHAHAPRVVVLVPEQAPELVAHPHDVEEAVLEHEILHRAVRLEGRAAAPGVGVGALHEAELVGAHRLPHARRRVDHAQPHRAPLLLKLALHRHNLLGQAPALGRLDHVGREERDPPLEHPTLRRGALRLPRQGPQRREARRVLQKAVGRHLGLGQRLLRGHGVGREAHLRRPETILLGGVERGKLILEGVERGSQVGHGAATLHPPAAQRSSTPAPAGA